MNNEDLLEELDALLLLRDSLPEDTEDGLHQRFLVQNVIDDLERLLNEH